MRAETERTNDEGRVFELARRRGKTADLKLGIEVNDTAFAVWSAEILGGRGNGGDPRVYRRMVFGLERGCHSWSVRPGFGPIIEYVNRM